MNYNNSVCEVSAEAKNQKTFFFFCKNQKQTFKKNLHLIIKWLLPKEKTNVCYIYISYLSLNYDAKMPSIVYHMMLSIVYHMIQSEVSSHGQRFSDEEDVDVEEDKRASGFKPKKKSKVRNQVITQIAQRFGSTWADVGPT